jgi:beta-xylosidase
MIHVQKPFAPQTSDEFNGGELGLQWQWHANHRNQWHSLAARPGWLRLFPQSAVSPLSEQPNLLLQKFPARSFAVETKLELCALQVGEEAGLVVAGETSAMLGVYYDGTELCLVFHTDENLLNICHLKASVVKLRAVIRDGGEVSFSFADGGDFISLPHTFLASKGKWIGAKVGVCSIKRNVNASAGYADFGCFQIL